MHDTNAKHVNSEKHIHKLACFKVFFSKLKLKPKSSSSEMIAEN